MKKNNKKGFTLGEMLVTVLILLLATSGMVTTIALASGQFNSSVRESEAQILCSTLKTIISDELCYTTEIHTDSSGNVTSYQSQNYVQEKALGTLTTDGRGSNGYGLIAVGSAENADDIAVILGKGSYTRGMLAKVTSFSYDSSKFLFTVTISIAYGDTEITTETFQVRNVNKIVANVS